MTPLQAVNEAASCAWPALLYGAEWRWPVLPLHPDAKTPLTRNGLHDASTDEDTITAWWERWPTANVGLVAGHRFDVLDIDVKHVNGFAAFRRIAPIVGPSVRGIVRTPSGGAHMYVPVSGDGNHTTRHGIDYRGRDGYVVAPPSTVDGRRYEWTEARKAPSDLPVVWSEVLAVLDPPRPTAPPRPSGSNPDGLVSFVAAQPEGNRNAGLFWAASRAATEGHDPRALVDAAQRAGLPRVEAERTVRSAQRAVVAP